MGGKFKREGPHSSRRCDRPGWAHPGTGKTIVVVNLLTVEGLHQILNKTVTSTGRTSG